MLANGCLYRLSLFFTPEFNTHNLFRNPNVTPSCLADLYLKARRWLRWKPGRRNAAVAGESRLRDFYGQYTMLAEFPFTDI